MENKSLKELEKLTEQGILDAICELAYRKHEVVGIPQDYEGAFELYMNKQVNKEA